MSKFEALLELEAQVKWPSWPTCDWPCVLQYDLLCHFPCYKSNITFADMQTILFLFNLDMDPPSPFSRDNKFWGTVSRPKGQCKFDNECWEMSPYHEWNSQNSSRDPHFMESINNDPFLFVIDFQTDVWMLRGLSAHVLFSFVTRFRSSKHFQPDVAAFLKSVSEIAFLTIFTI